MVSIHVVQRRGILQQVGKEKEHTGLTFERRKKNVKNNIELLHSAKVFSINRNEENEQRHSILESNLGI